MSDKPLVILHGAIKGPPLSKDARVQAGFLLRRLQRGTMLSLPNSCPMPSIGKHCHELRIQDPATDKTWRIAYRVDSDAILIAEIFAKKNRNTPGKIVTTCRKRLKRYDWEISAIE